jgi:type II secretory ATPase GspE/PulE/Tfp pilus assembly ATPase PilB-like protein
MPQFNDKLADARLTDLRLQEEERLIATLAAQYGYEYINLRGYTLNPNALVEIPETAAREAEIVAFDRTQRTIKVAAKNPRHPSVSGILETLTARKIIPEVYMCSSHSLEHAWSRYKDVVGTTAKKKGVFDFSEEDIGRLADNIKTIEDVRSTTARIGGAGNARRITETLELMFAGALALRASDIHIEPEEAGIRLRYRLDGVLHDVVDIDTSLYSRLLSRLKLLAGMTLNRKQEAQDGRFTFSIGTRDVIPAALGESVVMRLLDPGVASFAMEKLQLSDIMQRVMEVELKKKTGMIITTGPTGSGKTTALYAFLRQVHQSDTKIITIENPVEYKLEGIVQTQTGGEYSFADGLRSILRQDPDVIMVGEIRDREVAETALQAAQTGHLVFTTLHTNNAVGGFPRLINLGADPRTFKSAINIMLGQRLVRLLCPQCKTSRPATTNELTVMRRVMEDHPEPPTITEPLTIYDAGPGCAHCGMTGYKGRAGIFEAILMDNAVEEAVLRDPREQIILEAARPQKIPNMIQDGMTKVLLGHTSFSELERVVELPRRADDPQ